MAQITITGLERIIDEGWRLTVDKDGEWYYIHLESDTALLGAAGHSIDETLQSLINTYGNHNNNRPGQSTPQA